MQNYATWIYYIFIYNHLYSYIFIYIKTKDIYEDIANDVENRFDASNYDVSRPLPTRNNKKVIGLMKDELGGKIMTEFATLRPKTYSYLMDLNLMTIKIAYYTMKIILKSQQGYKSEAHNVYTEEVNKIALISNDNKRLQTYEIITSYPYGTSAGTVCKIEMLSKVNMND